MAVNLKRFLCSLIILALTGCAAAPPVKTPRRPAPPPGPTSNACTLFKKNPSWYWEALDTYNHWGVPVSVQMAIMQRESDFQAGVRPPKKQILGIIPSWKNISSAYGYAQALNGTWADYQQQTKNYKSQRDQFGAASDFIGWYCSKANKQLGIPLNNAYSLYLAYHEGLGGYANQSYVSKPWLLQVAQTVQARANQYKVQIAQCKRSLPVVAVSAN